MQWSSTEGDLRPEKQMGRNASLIVGHCKRLQDNGSKPYCTYPMLDASLPVAEDGRASLLCRGTRCALVPTRRKETGETKCHDVITGHGCK